MRAQLAYWLEHIAITASSTSAPRSDRFIEERDHLVPCHGNPYDTARVVYRVCAIDASCLGPAITMPSPTTCHDICRCASHSASYWCTPPDLRCVART